MIEVETVRELLKEVTPGEWLTENRPGQNGFVYALNADGVNRMFAGITAGKLDSGERAPEAESHANARLIAATPDIAALALAQAELLREAVRHYDIGAWRHSARGGDDYPEPEWVTKARAMLATPEGK